MKKSFFSLFIIILPLAVVFNSGDNRNVNHVAPPAIEYEQHALINSLYTQWVDSVFNSLTPDERIGQLFFAAAYSNIDKSHVDDITGLIDNHGIGGLIFFQGGPKRQALLVNQYQALSKTPLLIAMDAQWGLGMRLDSCVSFPRQMALDAIEDTNLIYQMGVEIGKQCQRMGIHLNFSPLTGLQEQRILVSTDIFRDSLKFQGLIYSDALNNETVTDNLSAGELEVRALEAGVDVLLMSADIPRAITAIKSAIDSGRIDIKQVEMSCRRILAAKEWAGLNKNNPIDTNGLLERLNSPETDLLNRRLVEASLTVVQNRNDILPLKWLDKEKTAVLITGVSLPNDFLKTLNLYEENDYFFLNRGVTSQQENNLFDRLRTYSRVIVSVHGSNSNPASNFGIPSNISIFIDKLVGSTDVILCLFANPYALSMFDNKTDMAAIVVGYQATSLAHNYMAQLLYGAIAGKGTLPVSVDSVYHYRKGIYTPGGMRLKYSIAEEAKLFSDKLTAIDSLVLNAINAHAMPGCQILAARNGIVFFKKEYRQTRYDNLAVPVESHHIYDLASVSKISATLPAIMALYDNGQFKLQGKLSDYLPETAGSNKADITMIDLLAHQSRIPSHIAFFLRTIEPIESKQRLLAGVKSPLHSIYLGPRTYLINQRRYKEGYYNDEESEKHPLQVAENLYILSSYRDSILKTIYDLRLLARKRYLYSDLGFILLGNVVERLGKMPLDELVSQHFFASLGASTLCFTPLKHFPHRRLVPTSNDTIFRKQWLQGHVHDENCALMGGVSGHAGLFGNANDLAKLMQMYLNNGTYGGERYIKEATLRQFTESPFARQGNRRGLGFDKPELSPRSTDIMGKNASRKSYGHTGFTGTMVWMDPENDFLFVFLSNRVCPDDTNNKLGSLALRAKIYETFVNAMK